MCRTNEEIKVRGNSEKLVKTCNIKTTKFILYPDTKLFKKFLFFNNKIDHEWRESDFCLLLKHLKPVL